MARNRLKMKDLERLTGVSRETIRFYIREGLLPEPERPARNVAFYDESFVERIRLIKELQEKRFLPLQVIKAMVGPGEAPPQAEVQALMELDGRIFPAMEEAAPEPEPERLSAVAKRLGIPVSDILEFEKSGVIEIATCDGDRWLDDNAVQIMEHWAKMRERGFTPERGLGPKEIKLHAQFVEWLAREELRIFSGAIAGRIGADEAADMAEAGITHLNHMLSLMRRHILLKYIAEGNVPDTNDATAPPVAKEAS